MGWGIDFTTNIYLSHQNYNSIYDVEDKINELEKELQRIKATISMLVAGTPRDLFVECDGDVIQDLQIRLDDLFDWYNESYRNLVQLEYYKEYLNELSTGSE